MLAGNNVLGKATVAADPPVIVLQQPVRDLGTTAARHLIGQLQGAHPPYPIIIRGSTTAPR